MNKDNKIFWIIGLTIAVILLLPYLGLVPKFGIVSDTDFMYMGSENYVANSSNLYILFGKVNLTLADKNYSFTNGAVYYILDNNASVVYLDTPNTTLGSHVITRYNVTLIEDNLSNIKWWIAAANLQTAIENNSVSIQLDATSKQICQSIGGIYSSLNSVNGSSSELDSNCTCQDGSVWYESSAIKLCPSITNTVTIEKKVQIEPTFFEKYGTAGIIAVIFGIIIIYLYKTNKRRKK